MRISTNHLFNQGLENILKQQTKVSFYQNQLSSGKKIQSAADDPVTAARLSLLKQRIASTEQYQINKEGAKETISLEENVLANTVNIMHRVRELQLQAGNDALSLADRASLAKETQGLLNQLLDLSNSQDSNGSYIFAGGKTGVTPFTLASGIYTYNGDETQRFQAVNNTVKIATSDAGVDVFTRIPAGNGSFTVAAAATNSGSGVFDTGSVVNSSLFIPDTYTIQFALNSSNELVYLVSGAAQGNILPATGNVDDAPVFHENDTINFSGISLNVKGLPAVGDSFTVETSRGESIFSTLTRMISNLESKYTLPSEKAVIQTDNNQILAQIDNALNNFLKYQAETGTRLNHLETIEKANDDLLETSKSFVSQLEDADLSEAAVKLNLQMVYLQAAQQSFVKIQSLSIFNML